MKYFVVTLLGLQGAGPLVQQVPSRTARLTTAALAAGFSSHCPALSAFQLKPVSCVFYSLIVLLHDRLWKRVKSLSGCAIEANTASGVWVAVAQLELQGDTSRATIQPRDRLGLPPTETSLSPEGLALAQLAWSWCLVVRKQELRPQLKWQQQAGAGSCLSFGSATLWPAKVS